MEKIIAKLLQDFEQGKMNRRQLISSLALTATAASAVSATPASDPVFNAVGINHISFDVQDYRKMRDFYSDVLGMRVWADTGMGCRVQIGHVHLSFRNKTTNTPRLDHMAIEIEKFDHKVIEAELNRRRIPWAYDPDTGVPKMKDPDGFTIQLAEEGGSERQTPPWELKK